ncbi:glycosyltransferase [Pseudidiomarina atlantica]|uniref:glycosyltransferase n=1 Tax=Pseudidiomarina atlantica TaxID=1517416 RepID=UPI000B29E2E9|nr:glycosyltransferase [Pseudidiomarina atlantica]
MKKKKLLIIYNKIWSYRLCIFNALSDEYELTVAVNDVNSLDREYGFNVIYLPTRKIGPFEWHTDNLSNFVKKFDCVIGLYDIRWLRLMLTSLISSTPFLFWGIGVTASYENKFDSKSRWDSVRIFFAKRSAGVLLYSDYPVRKHLNLGMSASKIWVCHNTTDVGQIMPALGVSRNSILFVGSLYRQKGILELLHSYYQASKRCEDLPVFEIVGDGDEFSKVKCFVEEKELGHKVILHGAIYDRSQLAHLFNRALVCISPNQAGLSVLSSMGMGVPFATQTDAFTGGEIFNIKHLENGIYIDKVSCSIEEFFMWIQKHRSELLQMGRNAQEFYWKYRQPMMTVETIKEAVKRATARGDS